MSGITFDEEGNVVETPKQSQLLGTEDDEDLEAEQTLAGEDPAAEEDPAPVVIQANEEHDAELAGAADDAERDAIRERRRIERRNRKTAQREREETLRRELASRDNVINELRQKVDVIERRNQGSELAQLDAAKKQVSQAYNYYKSQIALASEAGNHAMVADATDKMLQAQRKFDEIASVEKAFKQNQAAPQPLDPRLVNNAQKWMGENPWYDPNGKDVDSRITLTLDNQLNDEGWDPTTPEYWQELGKRVKKYLPHRVKAPKMNPERPRAVVAGSSREASSPAASKGTFQLSAERVQALKDAGIWDDPKARAEAVKRYRDYDKQQSQG